MEKVIVSLQMEWHIFIVYIIFMYKRYAIPKVHMRHVSLVWLFFFEISSNFGWFERSRACARCLQRHLSAVEPALCVTDGEDGCNPSDCELGQDDVGWHILGRFSKNQVVQSLTHEDRKEKIFKMIILWGEFLRFWRLGFRRSTAACK